MLLFPTYKVAVESRDLIKFVRKHIMCFPTFLMLAAIDAQGLDPLIH